MISEEEQAVGSFGNFYLYKGYYYDTETGLYYLNARYYDPTLGRFLTPDPDGGEQKDRLSLNPYTYVKNNPINEDDPDGHNWWARAKKWAARKYKQVKKEVKKITKKIEKRVQKAVKKLTSKVSKAIKSVSKAVKRATKAVKKAIKSASKQVTKAAKTFGKTLAKAYSSSPGGKAVQGIKREIKERVNYAPQKIKQDAQRVKNWFKETFGPPSYKSKPLQENIAHHVDIGPVQKTFGDLTIQSHVSGEISTNKPASLKIAADRIKIGGATITSTGKLSAEVPYQGGSLKDYPKYESGWTPGVGPFWQVKGKHEYSTKSLKVSYSSQVTYQLNLRPPDEWIEPSWERSPYPPPYLPPSPVPVFP